MKPSKVSRLAPEIRQELERLWREGRYTVDEMMEWLREQLRDANPRGMPSRTALGRYLAKYKTSFEKIREAQALAGHCVEQFGENPKGEVGRLLIQLLSALALQSLNQLDTATAPLESKELMFLSAAIRNLTTAEKTSMDRELRLRRVLAAELKSKVAAGVQAREREGGLSPEATAAIRAEIAAWRFD
jgi:hypothetical protein